MTDEQNRLGNVAGPTPQPQMPTASSSQTPPDTPPAVQLAPSPEGIELRYLFAPAGLATWGMFAGAVLGVGLISYLFLMMALPQGATGEVTIGLALTLAGATLGGGITVSSDLASSSASFLPLTTTVLFAAAVYFIARKRAGADSRAVAFQPVVWRAVVEGIGVALAAIVVFVMLPALLPDAIPLSATWWQMLFVVAVVTALSSLCGRASRLPAQAAA